MVRMTAAKCVSLPQFEVMLKVKQADNPEFAFLKTENDCHGYFIWLKQQEERTRKEKETVAKAGGMDLLGMYSSSSDEEQDLSSDEKTAQSEPSHEGVVSKALNRCEVSQPTEAGDGGTKRIDRSGDDRRRRRKESETLETSQAHERSLSFTTDGRLETKGRFITLQDSTFCYLHSLSILYLRFKRRVDWIEP